MLDFITSLINMSHLQNHKCFHWRNCWRIILKFKRLNLESMQPVHPEECFSHSEGIHNKNKNTSNNLSPLLSVIFLLSFGLLSFFLFLHRKYTKQFDSGLTIQIFLKPSSGIKMPLKNQLLSKIASYAFSIRKYEGGENIIGIRYLQNQIGSADIL